MENQSPVTAADPSQIIVDIVDDSELVALKAKSEGKEE